MQCRKASGNLSKLNQNYGESAMSQSITIADGLIVAATLLGPVVAVQAQKWVERIRETRAQKLRTFYTLMSTRALRASSPEHVQGLNSIDLVFDSRKRKEKPIVNAWTEYLDHLNHFPEGEKTDVIQAWNIKGEDLGNVLIQATLS